MSFDPGRTLYAAYIRDQLVVQEARKSSLEQRGLAVITTSGALVTLLFGLTALTTERAATFDIPGLAATFLTVAIAFFVLAALSALLTNLPRSYQGVTVDALREAVKNRWDDTEAEASRMVALTQLKVLASAKAVNTQKGYFLVAGMVFEIVAVALVGVAMGIVVWD
jgi:nitrate reductase NapE component